MVQENKCKSAGKVCIRKRLANYFLCLPQGLLLKLNGLHYFGRMTLDRLDVQMWPIDLQTKYRSHLNPLLDTIYNIKIITSVILAQVNNGGLNNMTIVFYLKQVENCRR